MRLFYAALALEANTFLPVPTSYQAFVEKLSGMKSLDKVMEAQSEFARSAYETFIADSQKIAGLYGDLAKQAVKPMEGLVAKFSPTAN